MPVIAHLGLASPQAFIGRARKARDAGTASLFYAWLMREGLTFLTEGWPDVEVLQPHFDRARQLGTAPRCRTRRSSGSMIWGRRGRP